MKKILIIFGSSSDARVYDPLLQGLKSLSIPFDFHISSAHKSPAYLQEILEDMDNRFSQIIAGAGLAAHLPGVIAAQTIRPVMGVPVNAALNGTDSLLSIMQMPPGVPVLSVGVDMYSEAVRNTALIFKGHSTIAVIGHGRESEKQYQKMVTLCSRFGFELEVATSFQKDAVNINLVGRDSPLTVPDDCLAINVPLEMESHEDILLLLEYSKKGLWVGVNRVENAIIAAVQILDNTGKESDLSGALHDFKKELEAKIRGSQTHVTSH